jgi:hypothetical protein
MKNNSAASISESGELIIADSGVFWFGDWIMVHNIVALNSEMIGKSGKFNIQVVYFLADKIIEDYAGLVYDKPLLGIDVLCFN